MFTCMSRFLLILFASLIFASCASVKEVTEVVESPEPEAEELPSGFSTLLSFDDLSSFRNTLDQPFLTAQNQVSTVFELTEDDLRSVDIRSGFRIQLLSTQDMQEAERISMAYYDWAIDRRLPFKRVPEAYVLFRQPNYRVRIGDFRTREQAISYLNILRPHFPGAWIVMDTIDPELIPED
jgi:hypothetical protein